jgi:hypothetical protein
MPRKIGENLRNDLKIWDPVSDSAIVLYYRIPTTEERIQYEHDSIEFVKGNVERNITKSRQKWGPEILIGIKEGNLLKKKDEQWVSFSSDPSSPQYDLEWKSLIQKYASDLIEVLAAHVFEGARAFSSQEESPEKN